MNQSNLRPYEFLETEVLNRPSGDQTRLVRAIANRISGDETTGAAIAHYFGPMTADHDIPFESAAQAERAHLAHEAQRNRRVLPLMCGFLALSALNLFWWQSALFALILTAGIVAGWALGAKR